MSALTVAWISDFPIEWLADVPEPLRGLPRPHALTWQRVLLEEFQANPALKVHVVVLRKRIARDFSFERNGVAFHVLKVPGGIRAPTFFWADTWLIGRKLKTIRPDLVHAWGTERGAASVARRLPYPFVVTIQGLLTWYAEQVPLRGHERFAACLEKYILARAPLATTESTFAVEYLQKKFPRLRVLQVEHAPNRIFHAIRRAPQTDPVRFIFVGQLDQRKGVDLLFSALEQLKSDFPFELVIVGHIEPGYRDCIQKLSAASDRVRIILRQDLAPEEVAAELTQATMMIFPTRADTSPNAVKEAVVAGVPVVGSAVGGILDYVFQGQNGLLFPSGNLGELVNVVRAACRHPLFGQGKVEPASLEKTRAYLSPERMARRFAEAYQIALAGRT